MTDSEIYSYDDKIKPIDRIELSIFGNEEVLKYSALGRNSQGIELPELYENQEPKIGGLIDPRLGPSPDGHNFCATCGFNSTECVGHFGHITLSETVFHVGFLQFVKKILGCICLRCSKLLIYKNEHEIAELLKSKSGKNRLNEIRNLVKNVTHCSKQYYGCGTPVSKIRADVKKSLCTISIISETTFDIAEGGEGTQQSNLETKKNKEVLTADMVYDILKNISDDDCIIMGLDPKKSRPEMMLHKIFPVPPVQIRPSAKADYMAFLHLKMI